MNQTLDRNRKEQTKQQAALGMVIRCGLTCGTYRSVCPLSVHVRMKCYLWPAPQPHMKKENGSTCIRFLQLSRIWTKITEAWMGGECGTHGKRCRIHTKFWPKNLNGPLERPKCRWENNIKTDLKDIRWGGLDSCSSGQGLSDRIL
jgi:hypothetical protein